MSQEFQEFHSLALMINRKKRAVASALLMPVSHILVVREICSENAVRIVPAGIANGRWNTMSSVPVTIKGKMALRLMSEASPKPNDNASSKNALIRWVTNTGPNSIMNCCVNGVARSFIPYLNATHRTTAHSSKIIWQLTGIILQTPIPMNQM